MGTTIVGKSTIPSGNMAIVVASVTRLPPCSWLPLSAEAERFELEVVETLLGFQSGQMANDAPFQLPE